MVTEQQAPANGTQAAMTDPKETPEQVLAIMRQYTALQYQIARFVESPAPKQWEELCERLDTALCDEYDDSHGGAHVAADGAAEAKPQTPAGKILHVLATMYAHGQCGQMLKRAGVEPSENQESCELSNRLWELIDAEVEAGHTFSDLVKELADQPGKGGK